MSNLLVWPILILPVLGGLVQVVYGELQLFGIYSSLHPQFPVTGSFFNPGPYAGYLAIIFPVALGTYIYVREWNGPWYRFPPLVKYGALATCLGILLVLSTTGSRAAWLAVVLSTAFFYANRYGSKSFERYLTTRSKKLASVVLALTLLLLTLSGMYLIRKNSADGRLLIWKASWGIIQEHIYNGVGLDRFKAVYMEAQADYFRESPDNPAIALADDTIYAFNEGLQLWGEQGTIGLILVLTLLVMVFRVQGNKDKPEIWVAQAGLLSLLVFGMFSYPSHILPIKVSGTLYLALLAPRSSISWKLRLDSKIRRIVLPLMGILSIFLLWEANRMYRALGQWKEAFTHYRSGNYQSANQAYEQAYPIFSRDGDFLVNYGKSLSMDGEHVRAVVILEDAGNYLNNTVVQTALGNSYQALALYTEAEKAYQLAADMLPDRFYPKYLLAKLYQQTGQEEKMKDAARLLLEKEPKVHSQAVEEIKEEMKKLLEEK